jgi:hypothetical protein
MEKTKTALTKDQNNLKKQHQQLIGRFTSIENSWKDLDRRLSPQALGAFQGSSLLTNSAHVELLNGWYGNRSQKWKLLYKGTTHGFGSNNFHSRCDNQGETLVVVQTTTGYIFGGWTPIVWRSLGNYASKGSNSWVFSLVNPSNTPIRLFNTGANGNYTIYDKSGYG